MTRVLSLVLLGSLAAPAVAQNTPPPIDPDVRRIVDEHYFAAHRTGDGAPLRGVFIDEGRMMWVQDGQLRVRASGEYINGFAGKPAPDERQRKRRVVFTDVTGDVAIAKVELDYPDALLTDYFSLLRLDGKWKIVHKTFHRQPRR